jgi:transcriptional regulator with XRE-family HTH domain
METSEMQSEWGRRVRRLRREKDLTATEVARRVGIHRNHLHRIEGGAACSDAVRVRIADVLEVEPSELFSYDLRAAS